LVAEEKVIFGLNAKAMSQLTLAKIRKVYNRADNRSIARQVRSTVTKEKERFSVNTFWVAAFSTSCIPSAKPSTATAD